MAIVYQSGSVYATSTGQLVSGRTKIAQLIFVPHSNGDELILHDGTSGSAPIKINIYGKGSNEIVLIPFTVPLVFNNGIYLGTISSNCHLTLVLTSEGAS